MSVFIIGDIHGHAEALRALVEKAAPGPGDVLIQLGDCINRGPDSFEVVEYWLGFDRCPYYVLGGNHEELLYEYLVENSPSLMGYGGETTIESYRRNGWNCQQGRADTIPPAHLEFYLQTLPWTRGFLSTSAYLFTHAGYDFRRPPGEQDPYTLRWGRVWGWRKGMPMVVRGHTPHRKVQFSAGTIGVDTGCGLGGALSCLVLPERRVLNVRPTEE